MIERDVHHTRLLRGLVGNLHLCRKRNDLFGEPCCCARRFDALLAFDDISILRFAADAIFFRDKIGRLVHRPPHRRHALLQRLIEEAVEVQIHLRKTDALHAASDGNIGFTRCDTIGDHRSRCEARAAIAVNRDAGYADAEIGFKRGVAGDVVAGRAFGEAASQHDILHFANLCARPLHGLTQNMRRHGNAVRLVERATDSLGNSGAAVGNDGDIAHENSSFTLSLLQNRRPSERPLADRDDRRAQNGCEHRSQQHRDFRDRCVRTVGESLIGHQQRHGISNSA